MGGERCVLVASWGLGVVGCLLGTLISPASSPKPDAAAQLLELVRVLTTTALSIVMVLGPGLALRAVRPQRRPRLGFLPLPGMGLLALIGAVAWATGLLGWVHPRVVSALLVAPVLAGLFLVLHRPRDHELLSAEEWLALLIVGGALGFAVARSMWSLGPNGQLFPGAINQTLEVGDRPDSETSYFISMLVGHGQPPFGGVSGYYYAPYTFSSRGPLSGLAATPAIFLSGGRPPVVIGSAPWLPFDPQGFMAYRLAMVTFAATSFLSLWTLTRRVAGTRAAQLAVLLAATTPFLLHEFWFTWPKLLAASLVLLAATMLLDRRWVIAGLLTGAAYLCHPLALVSLPALGLIALWPLRHARLRRPRIGATVWFAAALGVCLLAWRLFNGSHYSQAGFLDYVKEVGIPATLRGTPVSLRTWISFRFVSTANTLIPLRQFLLSSQDQEVNTAFQACFPFCNHGGSPAIVHFFFQYWNTLPFGMGIVFFPLLLMSLWRASRRWAWAVTAVVIVPFVAFAIYWGASSTGMLREGLHAWVLTLLVVVAADQAARQFSWFRRSALRGLLALRSLEVLLLAILPTIITEHRVIASRLWVTDTLAVLMMAGLSVTLAGVVWRWRPPSESVTGGSRESPRVPMWRSRRRCREMD